MPHDIVPPPYDQFLLTAERVAEERPDVDVDLAREVFHEVAVTLYNGLALDGLDAHDTDAVVAVLCQDLVADDPGTAVRARAAAVQESPGDLHDPHAASAALLISARMLHV